MQGYLSSGFLAQYGSNQPAQLHTLARNGVSLTYKLFREQATKVQLGTVQVGLCLCCSHATKSGSLALNSVYM